MWSQIVFRIFSIILLACSFEYVLFTQQIPWNWIDWILVFVVPIITVVSICGELNYTNDKYTRTHNIYDYDRIFRKGYWIYRLINAIICICLFWKLHNESIILPISQVFQDRALVAIGLFAILNFYYWLLGLLSVFCSLYVWSNCNLSCLLQYITSIGIIALGIIIMFIVANRINKFRWKQVHARQKIRELERKKEELEKENKFMIRELLEKHKSEQKWWKFWN